jgi:hypothetical protein
MIYLGTFITADIEKKYNYGRYRSGGDEYTYNLKSTPKHAYFAYPQKNGKYHVHSYPLTNKTVKELYSAEDRGKAFEETRFNDYTQNLKYLVEFQEYRIKNNNYWKGEIVELSIPISKIKLGHGYYAYICDGNKETKDVKQAAKVWFRTRLNKDLSI